MAVSLVDTTVLYAAGNRRAQRHEEALAIVRGADAGELPALRVADPILIETMNGLSRDVGHASAVDFLDRLRTGTRFEVSREPAAVWAGGLDRFERYERLSLADGLLVASAHHHNREYLYSFDDDFDGLEGITRLDTPTNPFAPE